MQRITAALVLALFAFSHGVAAQTIRVGRYTAVTGPIKAYEDGIVAALKASTGFTITTVPLASLADRITCLQSGTCDVVLSQFTVNADRQALLTFIQPYYFGDGAGIFVKNAKLATYAPLVKASTNAAIAYAGLKGKTFCNEATSAYNTPVSALGLIYKQVDSQPLIDADPSCDLTTSDSTAQIAGWTLLAGPLVPKTAAPFGIGVPLKTSTRANKAVRIALTEASVALYQGVPGKTPIENLNKKFMVAAVPSLKGATAPLANGAKFVNNFF